MVYKDGIIVCIITLYTIICIYDNCSSVSLGDWVPRPIMDAKIRRCLSFMFGTLYQLVPHGQIQPIVDHKHNIKVINEPMHKEGPIIVFIERESTYD